MNRHERRKAAALGHGRRTGYLHRLLASYANGPKLSAGVYHTTIEHDHWCGIYRGRDCNCVPNMSRCNLDSTVTIIDEDGNTKTVQKQ
jgi:hypothetical protein